MPFQQTKAVLSVPLPPEGLAQGSAHSGHSGSVNCFPWGTPASVTGGCLLGLGGEYWALQAARAQGLDEVARSRAVSAPTTRMGTVPTAPPGALLLSGLS